MKIILQNKFIAPSINFLQSMTLKGGDSRARSKLVKLLTKTLEDIQESEKQLLEEYGQKDTDGNLIKGDNDNSYMLNPETAKEYGNQYKVLLDEKAEIQGGTYVNHIDKIADILNNYDGDLSGPDAEVYDELLDAFEAAETGEK